MYAPGMTTRDIQLHLKDMYGVEVSPTLISEVTDQVMEQALGLAVATAGTNLSNRYRVFGCAVCEDAAPSRHADRFRAKKPQSSCFTWLRRTPQRNGTQCSSGERR
jgi:hypothetical protein